MSKPVLRKKIIGRLPVLEEQTYDLSPLTHHPALHPIGSQLFPLFHW
jgi:hypothetical protein